MLAMLPNKPAFACSERATGVEPASEAWEASVLPMNYARRSLCRYQFLQISDDILPEKQNFCR